jgi:phosphoribosylanthranilate isomerase
VRIPRVKVTGVVRLEDALELAHLGVDALGFHLGAAGTRGVRPDDLRAIAEKLPPWIARVGVLRPGELRGAKDALLAGGVGALEIETPSSPEELDDLPQPAYPALDLTPASDPRAVVDWAPRVVLLRARPGADRREGLAACWTRARQAGQYAPVLLGGSLGPGEVEAAVRLALPRGLDLGEGVEREPGVIDLSRVEAVLEFLGRLR